MDYLLYLYSFKTFEKSPNSLKENSWSFTLRDESEKGIKEGMITMSDGYSMFGFKGFWCCARVSQMLGAVVDRTEQQCPPWSGCWGFILLAGSGDILKSFMSQSIIVITGQNE